MLRTFQTFTRVVLAALMCGLATHSTARADNVSLVGKKVTVVVGGAQLMRDGKVLAECECGESFVVTSEHGSTLYTASRDASLDRSYVVPDNEAIDFLTNQIKDKESSANYLQRGRCWRAREEFDRAIADFTAAIQINPRSAMAYIERGRTWNDKKEFIKAIADFDAALRINPHSAWAYRLRGIAWCQQGDSERGIADFTSSIWFDPFTASSFSNRGRAHLEKGEVDQALVDLNLAIWLDPNDSKAYLQRGRAWKQKGDYRATLADYKAMAKVDATWGSNSLAWLLATCPNSEVRDGAEAVRIATQACELSRWENPYFVSTLSAALAESGRFDEALTRVEQVERLDQYGEFNELDQKMMAAFKAYQPYREP